MTIERQPEPHELMEDEAQAKAYAESDFSGAHNACIAHFTRLFPDFTEGMVLDIGCGHADPSIRLAQKLPDVDIAGLDGSKAMIELGKKSVEEAGLSHRINLLNLYFDEQSFPAESFDAIFSNSLLHHLQSPQNFWRAIKKQALPGAPVFVMDLTRPESEERARELVVLHSEGAPELMRRDFYNSLIAAYTPEEVRAQLAEAGLSHFNVEVVSDRHMIIHGRVLLKLKSLA